MPALALVAAPTCTTAVPDADILACFYLRVVVPPADAAAAGSSGGGGGGLCEASGSASAGSASAELGHIAVRWQSACVLRYFRHQPC